MTHKHMGSTPPHPRVRDLIARLYGRNERQELSAEESQVMRESIGRLTSRHDQIHSLFRFDEREPPKDVRFDAWGRNWNPRTDEFQWERFPNCYMSLDGTHIGAKLKVDGLPDYATGYRIEWWATVPVPPAFPEDKIVTL